MGHATITPLAEYLGTSYSPDREYVDGQIVERNLGEKDHSFLQLAIGSYFHVKRKALRVRAYVEQRVQVRAERYRISDVCVVRGGHPKEQIFTSPPFLCVEILLKDDRASDLLDRIEDYLQFGVPFVWVIDPRTRRAWIHTASGGREVKDGILATKDPDIALPLEELFAQLDD